MIDKITTIKKANRTITVKDKKHEEELKKYPSMTYAKGTIKRGKLSFDVNKATGAGWFLVHDKKKVLALFEIDREKTETTSIYEIIKGKTKDEVMKKGKSLRLDFSKIDEEITFFKEV